MIIVPKTEFSIEIDNCFLDLQYNYLDIFSAYIRKTPEFQEFKLGWGEGKSQNIREQLTGISIFKEPEFAEEIRFNVIHHFREL
jgi:hypothetical protein